jgi:hypothetical protein
LHPSRSFSDEKDGKLNKEVGDETARLFGSSYSSTRMLVLASRGEGLKPSTPTHDEQAAMVLRE